MSDNPLSEANVSSLDELMARDPLDLAKQDLDRIIDEMRRARLKWEAEPKATAKAKPTPKSLGMEIKLSDLGG